MVSGGFLSRESAPSEEACSVFPDDLEPSAERRDKNIFIFHDESTFNANDDESLQWGISESQIIRPKSCGSGIMVSDFIMEKDGYLCLSEEEYTATRENDPSITVAARTLLEYGKARDGYMDRSKSLKQMESAVRIAKVKYPKAQGYRLFWVFDQSGRHMAFGEDSEC